MDGETDSRMQHAVQGDTHALTELLRESAPRLREQLSIDKRWQSVLEVDDVLQITFLEAFLKISSFTPGGANSFHGWLKRIAENNLRDAIKGLEAAKRPPPSVSLHAPAGDNSAVALLDLLGYTSTTPSRDAAAGEARSAVDRALDALPPDYATVIRLYDLENRAIGEVAGAIGRSAGAVHMLRARAHERLVELIGPATNFFTKTS